MTPPPSAWCDETELGVIIAEALLVTPNGTTWEDRSAFLARCILASGCIEKKPTIESLTAIIQGITIQAAWFDGTTKVSQDIDCHCGPKGAAAIARAVLGVKDG